jgi:hypothetical protein
MKTEVEGLTNPKKLKVESPFDAPQSKAYTPSFSSTSKAPAGYYSMKQILASKFIFYPFDDLHIRPFNTDEILLINYAANSDSLRPLKQAINAAIYEDINCGMMTHQDVKQLMAWLRLNSYPKSEFTYEAVCTDKDHQLKVVENELPVESLINNVVARDSDFEINYVNSDKAIEISNYIKNEYDIELFPSSFDMHIELTELTDEYAEVDNQGNYVMESLTPEHRHNLYIATFAKYLSPMYGETLKAKCEFFSALKLPAQFLKDIMLYQKETYHSIQENLTTTCGGCGATIVTNVTFDPLSFFPDL